MMRLFKDADAIVEITPCDGLDELFYRLVIMNGDNEFIFHLTHEQASSLREALK